jgi:dCTP deaminase
MADNNAHPMECYSLLSDKGIKRHMDKGTIVIEPFIPENLSTSSYDVTLGPFYYRENDPEFGQGIYNPYSEEMVQKVWGNYHEAEEAGSWSKRTQTPLPNISDHEKIIWIRPGTIKLCYSFCDRRLFNR